MITERPALVPIIDSRALPTWSKALRFSKEFAGIQRMFLEKYGKTGRSILVPVQELREAYSFLGETLDQKIVVPEVQVSEEWETGTGSTNQRIKLTANAVKLRRETGRLRRIKGGETPSPYTIHETYINACNLNCAECCCAGRNFRDILRPDQAVKGLVAGALLGTREVEKTGGGEPTLYPWLPAMVELSKALGYKVGLITNGTMLHKLPNIYPSLDWLRYDIYNHEATDYLERGFVSVGTIREIQSAGVNFSAGYLFDLSTTNSDNENVIGGHEDEKTGIARKLSPKDKRATWETFYAALDWVDNEARIPMKIQPNARRPRHQVQNDIEMLEEMLKVRYQGRGDQDRHTFTASSDTERGFDDCFMHMVKPVITPANIRGDGILAVCPCFVYAPENGTSHKDPRFKVCDVDNMLEYYEQPPSRRRQTCSNCQFAAQNRLIREIVDFS